MKKPQYIYYFILLSLIFCVPTTYAGTVQHDILLPAKLIKALQSGGYIIYMRHNITDLSQRDTDRNDLEDCSSQRNLSTEGREQAKKIGLKIQQLNIPVGKVFSSPYCRCKDTAKLSFGHYEIEPDLIFSLSKNKTETEFLGARLYEMMLETGKTPDNTVFVGHTSNLKDGLGIWPKPEGVSVIFKKVNNVLIYKGMIKPDDWAVFKNTTTR